MLPNWPLNYIQTVCIVIGPNYVCLYVCLKIKQSIGLYIYLCVRNQSGHTFNHSYTELEF